MRHLFPKDSRFKPIKLNCREIGYKSPTLNSDFNHENRRAKSGSSGFGCNSTRFDYYAQKRKEGNRPSPFSYNTIEQVSRYGKTNLERGSITFGVSRSDMSKIHIDDIIDPSLKKKINNPGPGQHELGF